MKLNKIAFVLAAVAGMSVLSFAPGKKKPFEGKIVYEVSYDDLPEMLEPYKNMLPKETIAYVKGSKTRIEQNMMGSLTVNVIDTKEKTGFMLMDLMGSKTAYTMDPKDFEKDTKTPENYEVTYTKETKDIAGFKCTRVDVKDKTNEHTFSAWVTEEIEGSNKQLSYLKGFPLEYSVSGQMGMTISMKAKTVEETKLPGTLFDIPDGYEKKTMSDLQKQMEQMQKMQGGGDDE